MTHSPINFRDKTISQLVEELNSLGDQHVLMHPTTLIAIQDNQSQSIRRFRSRSMHKSRTSVTKAPQKVIQSQFFLADGSQKKYYYNQIANELENTIIQSILNKFDENFNTTIVMQYTPHHFNDFINKIHPWFNQDTSFLASFLDFKVREAVDLLSGPIPKTMPLSQSVTNDQPFYQTTIKDILKLHHALQQNTIKILKLMNKNNPTQLRIILLPSTMLNNQIQDAGIKIVKSQLTQILNYIKTYPNKKYQNINKLLPKRYPTTTAIAQILLYDSANFIINYVTQNSQNKSIVNGRFDFFDRFSGISNLVKKSQAPGKSVRVIKKSKSMQKSSSRSPQNSRSKNRYVKMDEIDATKTKTALCGPQQSRASNMNSELQYCRTFQRKTHKFSVDDYGQQRTGSLFPQMENFNPMLNQSQAIAVLKSQHAREISQYHQTIQNLNQKILVLTSQKGLSELYTIHQREIMLLQLKIQQLRKDISALTSKATGNKQIQNLKTMIKKLNEQISHYQKNNPGHKLAQGKIKMLQKQVSDYRQKYHKSEQARKQLTKQLEAMTKRLRIKDQQCGNLKQKQIQKFSEDDLAAKDVQTLNQIQQILEKGTNKDSIGHVVRKVRNILGDLSEVRETVLECNNFLVDLQDHLESRLSEKDPDVVLDCNRFIRAYLLQNLNIF